MENVDVFIRVLEPEIDKKCTEISEKKSNKKKQIMYILLLVIFITVPSLLIIFNISITYFIVGIILIFLLIVFMKLPDLLNSNIKGVCYE